MSGDWAQRPEEVPPHTLVGAFGIQEMPVQPPPPQVTIPSPVLRTVADSDPAGGE